MPLPIKYLATSQEKLASVTWPRLFLNMAVFQIEIVILGYLIY